MLEIHTLYIYIHTYMCVYVQNIMCIYIYTICIHDMICNIVLYIIIHIYICIYTVDQCCKPSERNCKNSPMFSQFFHAGEALGSP